MESHEGKKTLKILSQTSQTNNQSINFGTKQKTEVGVATQMYHSGIH